MTNAQLCFLLANMWLLFFKPDSEESFNFMMVVCTLLLIASALFSYYS